MSESCIPEQPESAVPATGTDTYEQRRLAALRRYDALDTPPEEGFDQITTLAAEVFGVPIALVNLVAENTQFSKSCYGIDVRNVNREVSFCTHTVRTDEVMVVLDAAQDPRFSANPLVTGAPHIRFYAGAPLRTPDGANIGALCIIDDEPHTEFPERDQAMLEIMARMAMDEFELRLANRRARDELRRRLELERDNERLIAELERKASFDGLTGLANRSLMTDRLRMAIADAERSETSTSVILMDLDNFKAVNDTYGHAVGDQVLRGVGEALTLASRDFDTVARWGGEEFTVLVPGCDPDAAVAAAERLRARVASTALPVPLTVSVGAAVAPTDARDVDGLLTAADAALYEAKSSGRNRVSLAATSRQHLRQPHGRPPAKRGRRGRRPRTVSTSSPTSSES